MKIYVWEYLDRLTDLCHLGGGLLIITDRDPLEVYQENLNGGLLEVEALPAPDYVYSADSDVERVVVFPDAGCC